MSSNGFQAVTIASGLGDVCVDTIDAAIADPGIGVSVQYSVPLTPGPLFGHCGLATTVDECEPLCNATVISLCKDVRVETEVVFLTEGLAAAAGNSTLCQSK